MIALFGPSSAKKNVAVVRMGTAVEDGPNVGHGGPPHASFANIYDSITNYDYG